MLVTKTQEQGQEAEQLTRLFANVSNRAKFVRDHKIPGGPSMVSQHLSGHRPISMEAGVAYARAFNVPLSTISKRLASMQEMLSDLTAEQELTPMSAGVAHDLSQARPTVYPSKATWSELDMGHRPAATFELEVRDGAFGEDYPPGCWMRLDPKRSPKAGWPVLVRDQHGKHYLRDYQLAAGGRWQAVARVRGFLPLDSIDDGLDVIAVMKGVEYP